MCVQNFNLETPCERTHGPVERRWESCVLETQGVKRWTGLNWLRVHSVRDFSEHDGQRPDIAAGSVHVVFVVNKLAPGHAFLRIFQFSPFIAALILIQSFVIGGLDKGSVRGLVSQRPSLTQPNCSSSEHGDET
jgi:hypothetical protein